MSHPAKDRADLDIDDALSDGELSMREKNSRIANTMADYDLAIEDNYGCTLILDSDDPFNKMQQYLEGHPKFNGEYQRRHLLEYPSAFNLEYRRVGDKTEYERAFTLELRKYKEGPLNVAHLLFNGTSVGNAGAAGMLLECVRDLRLPTHFGGSSKTGGFYRVGMIYKP